MRELYLEGMARIPLSDTVFLVAMEGCGHQRTRRSRWSHLNESSLLHKTTFPTILTKKHVSNQKTHHFKDILYIPHFLFRKSHPVCVAWTSCHSKSVSYVTNPPNPSIRPNRCWPDSFLTSWHRPSASILGGWRIPKHRSLRSFEENWWKLGSRRMGNPSPFLWGIFRDFFWGKKSIHIFCYWFFQIEEKHTHNLHDSF